MYIEEAKKDVLDLKEEVVYLLEQYEKIREKLNVILKALPETESPIKSKIENLITNYSETINKIKKDIIPNLDEMLKYSEKTKENLLEFTQNINITSQNFKDMLDAYEPKE